MKTKTNFRWLIKIVLISVVASMVFTLASAQILGYAGYIVAFLVLAVFIVLGIVFDVIGVAVTAAVEAPFHSMAAHRERGATESLRMIKNADKVSSFCNDVVGDITGIISGTTAALIAARLMENLKAEYFLFPLLISGAVTGLTVGGKAIGKSVAINNSTLIVLRVGKLINTLRLKSYSK
jgi:CBS domain containing-hemolysin-like protein